MASIKPVALKINVKRQVSNFQMREMSNEMMMKNVFGFIFREFVHLSIKCVFGLGCLFAVYL